VPVQADRQDFPCKNRPFDSVHRVWGAAMSIEIGGRRLRIEQKGIEFIPLSERYGSPQRLFTIWFSTNLTILCLTVGTPGISAGLSLKWTLIGLVIGNALGTVFMAAHSAQGPHLGIPQMIQSRAQFGVLGASIPLLAVVASGVFYSAANGILIRDIVKMILPLSNAGAIVFFGAVTLIVAFVGYEMIHRIGFVLTRVAGLFFAVLAILLYVDGPAAATIVRATPPFSLPLFMLVVTQATAWSLSSSPTVADYARYLPDTVTISEAFWYTALGNFSGSLLLMALGAYMADTYTDFAAHAGLDIARIFGPFKLLAALVVLANLFQVNIMMLYSNYIATVTVVSGLRGMKRVRLSVKFRIMAVLMAVTTAIAIATQAVFDVYFSDLLAVLVYTFTPWSAINLADYYVINKGHYDIEQMFQLDGIYGRFRWRTLSVYALSVVCQIPFMSLSFYVGPLERLIGADVAWAPGLLIPTLLYVLVEKGHRRRNTTASATMLSTTPSDRSETSHANAVD
jgi:NCS1 family nucleobase:cation symporter-1